MILSDNKIIELQKEHPFIHPFIQENVGPCSIDLTLLDHFMLPESKNKVIWGEPFPYVNFHCKEFLLPPGAFILASTVETISIQNELVGFIEGRSSVGRRGLSVQNAGLIDPGFKGRITLELFNASPSGLVLEAGRRICQLVLMEAVRSMVPYNKRKGSKYMDQSSTQGSLLEKEVENETDCGAE
jgi:dCTP deaminase